MPEVDPDDLKILCEQAHDLQTRHPGKQVAISLDLMKDLFKPGANPDAVFYRTSMICVLQQFAPEQLAPWFKDEQVSDAVFRTMATIPVEWIGHTERETLPFNVEDFFRGLRETE